MAIPRAMARPLGPRMFALPVGGGGCKESQSAKDMATLFGDNDENAPSTSTSSQPPEWALVELQGEVQPPPGARPEDSFTAGRLVLKPNGGVELIVGNHLLEGSFVNLKKPLAVLKKEGGRSAGGGEERKRGSHGSGGGGGDRGQQQEQQQREPNNHSSGNNDSTRYTVVGVVRRKCLFKERPRALIASLA